MISRLRPPKKFQVVHAGSGTRNVSKEELPYMPPRKVVYTQMFVRLPADL